jgi:hypothetical protein
VNRAHRLIRNTAATAATQLQQLQQSEHALSWVDSLLDVVVVRGPLESKHRKFITLLCDRYLSSSSSSSSR